MSLTSPYSQLEKPIITSETIEVLLDLGYEYEGLFGHQTSKEGNCRVRDIQSDTVYIVKVLERTSVKQKNNRLFNEWRAQVFDVKHPNLVRPVAIQKNDQWAFLVMPFPENGCLSGAKAAEETVYEWAKQIFFTVAYLHNCWQKYHGHISTENIFIDGDGNAKLASFGVAIFHNHFENIFRATPDGEQMTDGGLFEQDMWMLSLLLYELLCHESISIKEYCAKLDELHPPHSRWFKISDDARDLLKKLLGGQARVIQQVIQHKWFDRCQQEAPLLWFENNETKPEDIEKLGA